MKMIFALLRIQNGHIGSYNVMIAFGNVSSKNVDFGETRVVRECVGPLVSSQKVFFVLKGTIHSLSKRIPSYLCWGNTKPPT